MGTRTDTSAASLAAGVSPIRPRFPFGPILRPVFFASLFLATALGSVSARDGTPLTDPVFQILGQKSEVTLIENSAIVIAHQRNITAVTGFSDTVIKVLPVENETNRIRIIGLEPGITQVQITDEDRNVSVVEILVTGDVRHLEGIIRQRFPDSSIKAMKVGQAVLLQGWVTDPSQPTIITDIAKQFHAEVINNIQVAGTQAVQLHVKLLEVQRGKVRRLGFNWLYLRDGGAAMSTIGGLLPITAIATPLGGPAAASLTPSPGSSSPPTGAFAIVDGSQAFQGFIEALRDENLLKISSEPTIVSNNGAPAQFLSGGQFPIPVPQGLGIVSVQFRQFGAQLDFVPILLGNGRVRLQVRPEVSEQDFRNVITIQGVTVPSITTRRVQTEVEMAFGQTLVIAGLINNRVQTRQTKVPFLGELPWVGALFRRSLSDESETETIILVTPEYVGAMDPSQVPVGGPGRGTVVPTDVELFRDGYLEIPKYEPDPGMAEEPGAYMHTGGGFNGSDAFGSSMFPASPPNMGFSPGAATQPPAPGGAEPSTAVRSRVGSTSGEEADEFFGPSRSTPASGRRPALNGGTPTLEEESTPPIPDSARRSGRGTVQQASGTTDSLRNGPSGSPKTGARQTRSSRPGLIPPPPSTGKR
jgi:pilus assembly protein CpaC